MKKLVLFIALLAGGIAKAQSPGYEDLRILYADGNYEKLVSKADHYTQKDKTKSDALPHLWLARGLYKISLSGTASDKFKNAYKDAFGAMSKCIKLDKTGEVQTEFAEFIEEFKMTAVEYIMNELSANDYKKAGGWVTKYYKLNAKSPGAKLLEGVCKFRGGDKTGANAFWKDAETKIGAISSIESLDKAEYQLLKLGAMHTADCYVSIKQVDKAKNLLGKVAQWFEKEEDFKAKYDEIVN